MPWLPAVVTGVHAILPAALWLRAVDAQMAHFSAVIAFAGSFAATRAGNSWFLAVGGLVSGFPAVVALLPLGFWAFSR